MHDTQLGISAFHPYYWQILVGTLIATWNPECTEQALLRPKKSARLLDFQAVPAAGVKRSQNKGKRCFSNIVLVSRDKV